MSFILKYILFCIKYMTDKDYFNNIFENKKINSEGSTLKQTINLINSLSYFFKDYSIDTLLDAPCGDFEYMKFIYNNVKNYIGVDISDKQIERNRKKYPNINFLVMDIKTDILPKCDCILIRDLFVHLTYEEIIQSIINIKKYDIKYILTTTFPRTGIDRPANREPIISKEVVFWQPLNLQIEPFNFPKPILLINEGCTESGNRFLDKSLGLWLVEDINIV